MRTKLLALAAAGLLLVAAACSSDDAAADDPPPTSEAADDTASTTAPVERPECDQGATVDAVEATPVGDPASDLTVTSFDGTEIRVHWFPAPAGADAPVPTVLMGPGWSLAGDTSSEGAALFGALGIGPLNEDGYNVMTWDPRGFGESSGEASVNDPEKEGRDVQLLIDLIAEQPEALLDDEGDPRVGMIGASYGGGIQLTVGGLDCRVDALVPNMAWHSLETSLYPNETVKAGWASELVNVAGEGTLDPHITSAADSGLTTGTLSDEDHAWFLSRGPGDLVGQITAPTLLVSGTVDTLFTLQEAVTNYEVLRDAGVPVAMLWYCGGHGTCLDDPGDPDLVGERTQAWLDRFLKADEPPYEVEAPVVDVIDTDGTRWIGDDHPAEPDGEIAASSADATLALTSDSVAGPLPDGSSDDLLAGLVSDITPAAATTAVEVQLTADAEGLVLGAPHLSLEYQGTAPDGPEPTRAFAQIVDDATGHVLGNQITPVPLVLDGTPQTVELDMEIVARHVEPGDTLTLQLVATTPAFATPRLGGEVAFATIDVSLPTTAALQPAG